MNYLFYFGHPAQYHCMKQTMKNLRRAGHQVLVLIKKKDVLEELLKEDGVEYNNILPEGRRLSKKGILIGLIKRDYRIFNFTRRKNIDLFIGSDPALAHVGWIKRIPVITILEDDFEVIKSLSRITYPFTSHILTPEVVSVGDYINKKISYNGYMKLAYLHPKYFSFDKSIIKEQYFLIRLSGLNAYHDKGIKGMDGDLLDRIIQILQPRGRIIISSENPLPLKYNEYQIVIEKNKMHQLLAGSLMLISDSQSMSMEAAMLGVPSIRYSGLAGRISVLEELEHKYQLTFGIRIPERDKVLEKINELLSIKDLRGVFESRRKKMLSEKIDVTSFMSWLIEKYPESIMIMKNNPDYQYRFKNEALNS